MSETHIMIDLETAGKRGGAKILTVGARCFNLNGPTSVSFYGRIARYGWTPSFHEDEDTIAWWNEQSEEARKEAFGGTDAPEKVLRDLADWTRDLAPTTVWAKGTNFDVTITEAAFFEYGVEFPWAYNAPRCMRSVAKTLDPDYRENAAHLTNGLLLHHALADCDRQIWEIVTALNKFDLPIR